MVFSIMFLTNYILTWILVQKASNNADCKNVLFYIFGAIMFSWMEVVVCFVMMIYFWITKSMIESIGIIYIPAFIFFTIFNIRISTFNIKNFYGKLSKLLWIILISDILIKFSILPLAFAFSLSNADSLFGFLIGMVLTALCWGVFQRIVEAFWDNISKSDNEIFNFE